MLKKNLSVLAATLVAMSAGTLCGYVHPNYEKGKCWEVEAEYLYWLPDVGNTLFVANSASATSIDGPVISNPFGFHSGFRVGGAYALDCVSDLQVRYARLRCGTSKTVTGDNLYDSVTPFPLGPYIGYASSDLEFFYQNVELLYSTRIWDSCSFSHFYVVGGLQYYYFSYSEDLSFVETSGGVAFRTLDRSCHNYGIGPEFGFEFVCPLNLCWCGWDETNFAIVGQASAAILAHHGHAKYLFVDEFGTNVDTQAENNWRVVPAWNARLGLQYASSCWCMDFDLEIGYEFNNYIRSLERFENLSFASNLFLTQFNDVDMQGLYVSLGLTF